LQKVKNTRDKLVAVGTLIDNEELLHIILKGLPREYSPFCSAIRTRNEPVSFEEIMVLLQTEEQSISDVSDSGKDLHSMALFASATANNKNSNSQSSFYVNNSQSRGRGRTTIHIEVEEEAGSITTLSINTLRISINLILSLKGVLHSNRNLMVQDLSAKSVANLDIKLLIATIAWTLHIKADIHLQSWLPWLQLQMVHKEETLGSLILEPQTTSLPI
jgi:hypothetical protein